MLYTYHVSSGAKSYVTQHQAEHWEGAKQVLIASEAFRQFAAASMPCTRAAPVVDADVFLLIPMTGLKHCWLMQGGRQGEYFTAVIVRTDDTGDVEDPCDEGDTPLAHGT